MTDDLTPGLDKVRARLDQMSKNFKGLGEAYEQLGMTHSRNMIGALSRLSGQLAAREDWGKTLWNDDGGDDDAR